MNAIVVDIETVPDLSVIPMLKPVKAQAKLRDPKKIAASLAEKQAAQLSGLSLDPATCRIVALGYGNSVFTCKTVDEERAALTTFWIETASLTLVGYNCVAFDLPVLLTRSRILGVSHPRYEIRKYGCPGVVDLMLDLSFGGVVEYKSLDFWCKRLGLTTPDDPTSGADIARLVELGEWDKVIKHCACDIAKTSALARKLWPELLR